MAAQKCKKIFGSIVCTPCPFLQGGWASNQIFKKGEEGLTGPQLLEGVAEKEGGDFFQGCCNMHIKIN